jgi:hypothetical protein
LFSRAAPIEDAGFVEQQTVAADTPQVALLNGSVTENFNVSAKNLLF